MSGRPRETREDHAVQLEFETEWENNGISDRMGGSQQETTGGNAARPDLWTEYKNTRMSCILSGTEATGGNGRQRRATGITRNQCS